MPRGRSKESVERDRHAAKPRGEKEPARRAGTRPPFPTTHGAKSDKLVLPRARELVPEVLEANPQLDPQRDGPAIFRYAVILSRIERVYRWLGEQDGCRVQGYGLGSTFMASMRRCVSGRTRRLRPRTDSRSLR